MPSRQQQIMSAAAPEARELVALKSNTVNLRAGVEEFADALAAAIRGGQTVLVGTDLDGTALAFNRDPMKCRMESGLRDAYAALNSLPGVNLIAITGGAGSRTAHVLAESGLPIRALSVYGTQTVDEDGTVGKHRLSAQIEPVLLDVRARVEKAVHTLLGLDVSASAILDDATEAQALNRLSSENKGNIRSFQVKGSLAEDRAFQKQLFEVVVEAARAAEDSLDAQVRAVFADANEDLSKLGMPEIEPHNGKILKVEAHNGSIECIFPLGLNKETAVKALVQEFNPALVAFNADDLGDVPALKALADLSASGIQTISAVVYNAPNVPFAGLKGTPTEVVEKGEVVLLSCKELGAFYADALRLAAERNADLTVLAEAAATLPVGLTLEASLANDVRGMV